ncbi:MmgE/PrpD family protein [Chelatococcus sp. GCM10030263]|uniref:MmgE/PrpD family protein n=1 Tax=Chelatococcus sp. GCM10030263 TaxID=3273387 RepID=UPI003608A8F9
MPDIASREAALARAIVERASSVPPTIRALACEHIADFAGVAAAGLGSDSFARISRTLAPQPAQSQSAARVWGGAGWLPARDAAMLNAVAGHVDDFDDDEAELSLAHPTVTILTAAGAAADLVTVPGSRLVEAYVAGVELVMRLGAMLNPAHYTRGFHATATLGALGAAVSAGLVLGLDRERLRHALGIAASLAGGLRSNFGSDTKSLQTGNAARSGLMAAELARDGVSSTPGSLFGPLGFVPVFGGRVPPDDIAEAFGAPWLIDAPGITIKAYPCCTCAHTALDSLFALMAEHRIEPQRILRIEVDVDEAAPRILIHDNARTALEGKFSMPFCLAAGLLRGRLGLAEFDDALVLAPETRSLMERVVICPDPSLPKPDGRITLASRLRLLLQDGTVLERHTQQPSGSRSHRLSKDQLSAKFTANAASRLGPTCKEVFETLLALDRLPDAARGFDALCSAARFDPRASRQDLIDGPIALQH